MTDDETVMVAEDGWVSLEEFAEILEQDSFEDAIDCYAEILEDKDDE